jgi:hypothetical protein
MTDRIVAEFLDPTEALLAQSYLASAGIDARVEGPGEERRLTGDARAWVRLLVPESEAEEAAVLLAEQASAIDTDDGEVMDRRPPLWVALVAAVVALALIAAAVPYALWPWLLVIGLVAFLLWRAIGPRVPKG